MLELQSTTIRQLVAHAESAFPEECCGVVLTDGDTEEVHRITNIQGWLHAKDPKRYPRGTATGYFMDPKEFADALKRAATCAMKLKLIYHSHPDHEPYFSKEDRERAVVWDEPAYPDSAYIVLSVFGGVFKAAKAFQWDRDAREFVEIPWRENGKRRPGC